ncbi:NERD domain-containing protein [Echinicola shivajiensis]|uniref:NERD domain-containing protein n=1 Tax=Echinicola shivajiensis TaxID=1035916 RepID=UPI001BFCC4C7|nr:NERD domain-containing protein [Echinicola shivajiensis]
MNEGAFKSLLIALIALLAILFKLLKPKLKGILGEANVSLILKLLNRNRYKVINDVLVKDFSRSSQIDHIVVSNYGLFVIETKNYKGWIFGHESSSYWTQTIYGKKYKFRNPVLQNWGHINTLKAVLPDFPSVSYYSVIVFTGNSKLKRITSKVPVLKPSKLLRYISKSSKNECLSNEEVDQIYQKLISLNRLDKGSRKSHIRKAKTNQRGSVNPITCPRCGGGLSIKQGKYGMFYGCSNYPSCDFTKDYRT